MPPGPRPSRQNAAFHLLALASAVPLFLAHYPPLQDLPQHAAAVRVLTGFGDPALRFPEFFELTPFSTPYWSVYALASLLALEVGALTSLKLVLAASLVAIPHALRALLRALDKPEAYALLALPLAYNAQVLLGFLNFIAGLPSLLFGIALVVRLRRRRETADEALLAVVACFTFFSHVAPYAVLALAAFVFAVEADWKQGARRLLPFLPSAVAVVLWLTTQPSGKLVARLATDGERATYVDFETAVREVPLWLTDIFRDGSGSWLLSLLALLVLGVCAASFVERENTNSVAGAEADGSPELRLRFLVVLGALVPAYFLLPASHAWIWPLNARLPILIALLGIAALPALGPRLLGAATLGAGALSLLSLGWNGVQFRRASAETAGLAASLARVPAARKIAGLIFDPTSTVVRFAPYLHAAAWYQAERGGAVVFSFADFPQSPYRFRTDSRRPQVPPRWEWQPYRVDTARDLEWFDYLLCRRAPRVLPGWSQLYEQNGWSIWSKVERDSR